MGLCILVKQVSQFPAAPMYVSHDNHPAAPYLLRCELCVHHGWQGVTYAEARAMKRARHLRADHS